MNNIKCIYQFSWFDAVSSGRLPLHIIAATFPIQWIPNFRSYNNAHDVMGYDYYNRIEMKNRELACSAGSGGCDRSRSTTHGQIHTIEGAIWSCIEHIKNKINRNLLQFFIKGFSFLFVFILLFLSLGGCRFFHAPLVFDIISIHTFY